MARPPFFEADLEATMRDGTILRADAYRPPGDGPWPVLLARTPYGKQDSGVLARIDPQRAAARGFLAIVQDCRGRYRSEGEWEPLAHESADGYDTVTWAACLPGSDGRVATYGPSYLGHTQLAAVRSQPPQLRAAIPAFTWSDPRDGLIARGGAAELGLITQWTLTLGANVIERRYANDPAERRRRLAELESVLEHVVDRTYWELPAFAALHRLRLPVPSLSCEPTAPARIPTLTIAGWFDSFLQGSLDNHAKARDAGAEAALIVGPWSHGDSPPLDQELDWLDETLNTSAPMQRPPVLLFVMGANEWRRYGAWPPEHENSTWFLHERGVLSLETPTPGSPPDTFDHDPHTPVPTHGGALLLPPEFPAGPVDQKRVEERDDVLVYTSDPLREPLNVIGRVSLHLFAHSTAPTADWVARLCDVDSAGVSRNITDGVARISEAGEFTIDLWSTAHVFRPGHRIRVQITGSCFPRWDRNLIAARQSVCHDPTRPSRLVLPRVGGV